MFEPAALSDTPAGRLESRFAKSPHPLLTDDDFTDVRTVLAEHAAMRQKIADLTDPYEWAVYLFLNKARHGQVGFCQLSKFTEREARALLAEKRAQEENVQLYRQRRGAYNNWQHVKDDDD